MEKCTRKPLGKIILFSLAALIWTGKADLTAQSKFPTTSGEKIKFEQVTVEDGISQGTIKCILQDKQGYLWLGTESGLNRYDGYNFKTFQHEGNDKHSLSSNVVNSVWEDHRGDFWVGTENGLNHYKPGNEEFYSISKLKGKEIITLNEDHDKSLWVGTREHGLYRLDRERKQCDYFTLPRSAAPAKAKIKEGKISIIFIDNQGIPWFGSDNGLFYFDTVSRKILSTPVSGDLTAVTKPPKIRAILEAEEGIFWLGTFNYGLLKYDKSSGSTERFKLETKNSPTGGINRITAVLAGRPGEDHIWIGTSGFGVFRFHVDDNQVDAFQKHPGIRYSLSNDLIYSLYRDRSGVLWIGTENALNKVNIRSQSFTHWTVEPGVKNSLNDRDVWAIIKDRQGNIWVGTNEGLDKIDGKTGEVIHFTPANSALSKPRVFALCEDSQGILWVGTQGGGLNRIDLNTGEFLPPFTYKPEDSTSLCDNSIGNLLVDSSDTLWVGTWEGGLNRYNRESQSFTRFTHDESNPASLSSDKVTSIYEEPEGILWIGTSDGLNRFHPDSETFTVYKPDPNNETSLGIGDIYAICRDKKGNLWVGTADEGLNKLLDSEVGTFKQYRKTKDSGPQDQTQLVESVYSSGEGKEKGEDALQYLKQSLPSDIINGILEDETGCLWLSTNRGLTRFDPEKETFFNYNERDGLQSQEFHGGSFYKRPGDTQMFFGGGNGFNAFYPSRIEKNNIKPNLVVEDVLVNYEPYPSWSRQNRKKMELMYHDSISFEFKVLDFTIPEKNKYLYKLEPIEKKWSPPRSSPRFAIYNQLPPGIYSFKVRGSNNDGLLSDEVAIRFRVLPPFYLTWWFLSCAGFLIALVVFGIYRMRTGWLREKLDEQERVSKILKQSRDEMEAARNLAEFRHAEIEVLLTAISAILIAVDSQGAVFQWNQPSVQFFNISRQQALRRKFIDVLRDYISENQLNEIMENGLTRDTATREIEIQVNFGPSGKSMKLLLASISPIMDRAGKQLGFLFLAEDITNRKEEEIMSNLSKKLEALGQMASGIAHEIKTPLQYIGHNARFVGDSFNDVVKVLQVVEEVLPIIEASGNKDIASRIIEKMKEYDMEYVVDEVPKASEQIVNGVGKVSEIIQSMTEYSYPGRGFKEKCDINEILRSTLVVVQNAIKKKADIDLELYERLPHIPCFPGELSQVFLNMLVNAMDAIDESGKWGYIKISTSLDLDDVIISISDSGTGIPENCKDNIFNPFFTTKRVGKGTGQGLSLAHNVIIEKHGGKLDFSSKVGEGTSFYIRLPLEMEGEH